MVIASVLKQQELTVRVFYGLNDPGSQPVDIWKFEYVIIIQFFDDYRVKRMLELTRDVFIKYKR